MEYSWLKGEIRRSLREGMDMGQAVDTVIESMPETYVLKHLEVRNSDYDALQKAYSIWICMNCPPDRANTITRYSLKEDLLYGTMAGDFQARYDLLQVIMIRLPKEKQENKAVNPPTKLMKILSTLFSEEMSFQKKINRLTGLGIVVTEEMRERMNVMCNLSEGIYEAGRADERAETERQRARADQQQARADEQ